MSDQGPPAPLATRSLTIATLAALLIAGLALTVYILPANYGLDPIGTGQAFGIDGQPPEASQPESAPALEANTTAQTPQLYRYQANWPTTSEPGPSSEAYTAENQTTTVEVELPANTTTAKVNLTWTDDNETAGQESEPDELELVLEAPNGSRTEPVRAENPQGGEGTLTTILTTPRPAERAILAADDEQARRQALAQAPGDLEGSWKAHVTVLEAGDVDTGPTVPTGSPAEDEGTAWQLSSQTTTSELALAERDPADVRQDTHTFELAPGEGMEHKVGLAANTTLAYAWETTSEVFYDFHGEPEHEDGFSSYETDTRSARNGTFTPSFTGTHGWYWENQGSRPVTIELTTRGDYATGFTT